MITEYSGDIYGIKLLVHSSFISRRATHMLLNMFHDFILCCVFCTFYWWIEFLVSTHMTLVLKCLLYVNRFLLGGIELLSYYLVPSNMVLELMFGLQAVYLLNFFFVDLFCR